jgi:phosphonate transport system permease protein
MPLWLSYGLYRFESNVRGATVLGIVGAGGIGQLLFENIRGFYYGETAAIMIVMVVTVAIIDMISQRLRKVLV